MAAAAGPDQSAHPAPAGRPPPSDRTTPSVRNPSRDGAPSEAPESPMTAIFRFPGWPCPPETPGTPPVLREATADVLPSGPPAYSQSPSLQRKLEAVRFFVS